MPKQLLFDEEARAALVRGVNIMSHAGGPEAGAGSPS
jgi:hypothetical protein